MDVGLADFGLHDCFDGVGVQDADRDVLCDDLFALALHGEFEGFLWEGVVWVVEGVYVLGVVVIEVVRPPTAAETTAPTITAAARVLGAVLGHGVDCHGQHWDAIPFGEPQAGIAATDGRLESALQGSEGKFEVDGVVGFSGLDVVVVEDQVDRERAGRGVSLSGLVGW